MLKKFLNSSKFTILNICRLVFNKSFILIIINLVFALVAIVSFLSRSLT